ncbi:MAG: 1-phosphofructokinase [Clostridiales bacterium]|nr:1-phosphofructokinase [Clostridiales bacterium]
MIYTVTCNPSLDYVVSVDGMKIGKVNRTNDERILAGGKGINVSMVLNNLGVETTAFGFAAGFTGDEIERILSGKNIRTDFIRVSGMSRINVKIRAGEEKVGGETEINGRGPQIEKKDAATLREKISHLGEDDVLVLAGSIPSGVPNSFYRDLINLIDANNVRTVVDATGELLTGTLAQHPFLIKPNVHELGEIFGRELRTRDEIISCARELQRRGAANVLVSMAGDGAILAAEDGRIYEGDAPAGELINSVGSGDSMVAGFLYGYLTEKNYAEAFRWGVCAGSASAFSEELATREQVERLLADYTAKVPDIK